MADSTSLPRPLKAIWGEVTTFMLCPLVAISLLAYGSIILLPAFNADDIIQSQGVSGDHNTFLAQGRWGYYLIFKVLQDGNPLGPAGMILGVLLLLASSIFASYEMPIRYEMSRNYFVLVSTVSLYWAQVFSYDSTRLAYPTSILLLVFAYALMRRKRYIISIICLVIAAAIFQASIQVFLTYMFAAALLALCRNAPASEVLKSISKYLACLLISLIFYLTSIKLSPLFTGIPLNDRAAIDPLAAIAASDRISNLLLGHALPNGYDMPYFNLMLKTLAWLIMIAFLICAAKTIKKENIIVVIIVFSFLIISPFILAFVTPLDEFSPRALIGFSVVTASYAGIALDIAIENSRLSFTKFVSIITALYIFFTSIQINAFGYDEYLGSRNDFLATNRLISRIETVIAVSNHKFDGKIPIVVRYRNPVPLAPRGFVGTSRGAPWSREWIFRMLDPKFVPASEALSMELLENAPDVWWPDKKSVYIANDVVVVLIN